MTRLVVVAALAVAALAAAGLAVALGGDDDAAPGGAATTVTKTDGGAAGAPAAVRTDVPTVRRLLTQRLIDKKLNYRYVVCVRSPARFEGGPVVRCNVNFNAPHIEVYCGVVRDGRLLTNHESSAVPCPRDDVGRDPPVRVWG